MFLKKILTSKVQGWKRKFFSQLGKEILINSAIQPIPTYVMSLFKLPSSIISEFQKLVARFWWSNSIDKSNIHWFSWSKMTNSKRKALASKICISSIYLCLQKKLGDWYQSIFFCPHASATWFASPLGFGISSQNMGSFSSWWNSNNNKLSY